MKIHYISDLHLDFYIKEISNIIKLEKLLNIYINKTIISQDDIIIIAGDISHYNIQIVETLKYFSKMCKVLFVTGNHEFYNISNKMNQKYINTYDKFNELKEMTKDLNNIYMLDGNVVEINGLKIGGAMGWYDGSYTQKLANGLYQESTMDLWNRTMNDSNLIPKLKNFYEIYDIEILKIKKVLKLKPDIMVSHVSPISEAITFDSEYKLKRTSGFYSFDGLNLVEQYKPKYWIYGHIHSVMDFEIFNCKFLRNPVGYPKENQYSELKNIILNKKMI